MLRVRSEVQAVREWPTPNSRKQLQHFLGFENFYRKFIKNFSSIAAPVHALTSAHSRFTWTRMAKEAFQQLKDRSRQPWYLHCQTPSSSLSQRLMHQTLLSGQCSSRDPRKMAGYIPVLSSQKSSTQQREIMTNSK